MTARWSERLRGFGSLTGRTPACLCAYGAVAAALAAVFWFNFPLMPQPEFGYTHDFVDPMRSIEAHGSFTRELPGGRVIPETLREPFYPYALAVADSLFGNYRWIVNVQVAAVILVCLTWVFIAWRLLGFCWAAGLAGLLCFNQPLFFYPVVLYPYAFDVFFLSAALFCGFRLIRSRRPGWAVAAGACFALAVYERGSLELLPLFLAFCWWWVPAAVSRRSAVVLAAVFLLGVSPWLARNARLGVTGMHGLMGQIVGYAYGDLILAENDRTAAEDPYGLRPQYLDYLRREGSDGGSWDFYHALENGGRTNGEINRIMVFYVKQGVRRRPWAAVAIVAKNLAEFPCRLLQRRVPLADDDMWAYYVHNLRTARPSAADWLVTAAALLGAAAMAWNREPLLALILPVMFYFIPVNTLLTLFDPRYRNGLFDVFAYFLLLYGFRFAVRGILRRDGRAGRIV